jgi:DNA replicative helicase MCM subunit Mcm2 (Cdc46/Mcm family)
LIRLCQARAKAELYSHVTREHALDVIELMTTSVKDVHCDENGKVDPIRGGAGGISKRKLKTEYLKKLHALIGVGAECSLEDLVSFNLVYSAFEFSGGS